MKTVKVAVLRNETDRLFRLANSHYHACVGVIEVQRWQAMAARVLDETAHLTCKRATAYDLAQWAEAVDVLKATLARSAERVQQIQTEKPKPPVLRLVAACERYSHSDKIH
ncbi:hypothetical protein [Pseudomonas sp. CFBP 13602]|uniref:hypothetical protein n=1 Tax=Pseudomonas sp. CFBP 13602 TaxID=2774039 RepID=UPI00177C6D16|nr:hypothetical protein [Pseudomonas sp. CFBP 13602]MBD8828984.1 hypothetical protein [Pseudomonas sp. CFBP 13602]